MVDAVVLAGGSTKGLPDAPTKGLVCINGRPMVEYVVDTLLHCTDIGRICVVLPIEHRLANAGDRVSVVVTRGSLPQATYAGIESLGSSGPVLVLSADVPMITSGAIADFLEKCLEKQAEVYYPIVRYGESEKRFSGVKRTYVRLREGKFTGGNIALIDPEVITRNMGLMEEIFELRKSPFKLFQLLGITFLVRFALGMLSIGQVEKRASKILNASCAAIITPFVEIGLDVDKESDLQIVASALSGGLQ